jgi:hypothetical protein
MLLKVVLVTVGAIGGTICAKFGEDNIFILVLAGIFAAVAALATLLPNDLSEVRIFGGAAGAAAPPAAPTEPTAVAPPAPGFRGILGDIVTGAGAGASMNILGLSLPLIVYANAFGDWSLGFPPDTFPTVALLDLLEFFTWAAFYTSLPFCVWLGAAVVARSERPLVVVGAIVVVHLLLALVAGWLNTGGLLFNWVSVLFAAATGLAFYAGAFARNYFDPKKARAARPAA